MIEFDILRIFSAFICGYALCQSGSLTQVVTSNPLASPSTLGFDGLVVLVVLVCHGLTTQFALGGLQVLSFAIFLGLLVLYYAFTSWRKSEGRQLNMNFVILLGLGFNLLVGAVFSVVQFLFMSLNKQFPSGLWFGNFRQVDEFFLVVLAIVFGLSTFVSIRLSKSLGVMTIDNTTAVSLGIDVGKCQKQAISLSLLLTGAVICFFGVFSFLGLIFPHLIRSLPGFKGKIKNELLYGPLIAGLILAVLDQACYNFTYYGAELPVGMVSSVLGSALLISIVIRKTLA